VFPIIGAAVHFERRRILVVPSCFDQNVLGLIPGPRLEPEYLLMAMQTIRLGELARVGAVPVLNQAIVGGVGIVVPSKAEQLQAVRLVQAVEDVVATARARLVRLQTLRGALLQALVPGRLALPPSYDRFVDDPEAQSEHKAAAV
jgi:type I restriction enzyme, S subunit